MQAGNVIRHCLDFTVIELGGDTCHGQIVFAREEALRQQFTWADIMDLVTPPGAAGLKIFVRDGVIEGEAPTLIYVEGEG